MKIKNFMAMVFFISYSLNHYMPAAY